MEIQDRNNLLQLAMNLSFDAKNPLAEGGLGFIDMLKIPATDNQKSTNQTIEIDNKPTFKSSSEHKLSFQEKTEQTPNKKENNQSVKVKTKKATATKENKSEDVDNNLNTVATTSAPETEENSSAVSYNTPTETLPQDEETVAFEDVVSTIGDEVNVVIPETEILVPTSNDISDDNLSLLQTLSASTETQTYQKTASQDNEVMAPVAQETAETEDVSHKSAKHTTSAATNTDEIPEKDNLLLRQAEYIDHKIGHSHQIKIDVKVNEEKIAEPLNRNVVQNSFELTSMLQTADNTSAIETPADEVTEKFSSATVNPKTETTHNDILPQGNVMITANVSDNNISSFVEEVTSIASVRANPGLQQTFAKNNSVTSLQESDNDNALKGMGKEVIEQIKVNITKSAVKNIDKIDIELKPEDLGKVQIRMYISKDGRLHADIISSRQETSDLLQREIESLSKSFQDAGYDTDKQSFNFTYQEENQADKHNGNQKFQQFIGEALEQEIIPAAVNDTLVYDPKVGLNIRV